MIRYVTFLVLCAFALGAWAQNPVSHQHATAAPDLIDGSKNPELIPDSTAYRLFFLGVSEMPSPSLAETTRQRAHLTRAGLKENDLQAAAPVLASFKTQYAALIAQYNESADVKAGSQAGLALFLSKREALVQATRDELRTALSPKGMASFHAHVIAEKVNMKVAKDVQ
jgi:hypothetical protein